MQLLNNKDQNLFLSALFETTNPQISTKDLAITNFYNENTSYIFIKKLETIDQLREVIKTIVNTNTPYTINIDSFVNEHLKFKEVLQAFVSIISFETYPLFSLKKKPKEFATFNLYSTNPQAQELYDFYHVIAQNRNLCRDLQIRPENFCNSEQLASLIEQDFKNTPNVKVKVLDRYQIQSLGMNLLLSVNKGSTYEPRVVVLEYNGNPQSEEKTVFVGKGITFDTGGVNTKGYFMGGMKFDMSGSVIVAYALKSIAELKLKQNVAAIMMITDNRLAGDASLPENVYMSMANISVEVTDTDAEGRLVLADGLYYGAKVLKATTLVDVATLTGAMVRALGSAYTGIWATDDAEWDIFVQSAKEAQEKVWRMPLHEDFHEPNEASLVADLNNYNNSELSDCNTAAMFLKQFTNDVKYIHCDVAGTADIKGNPQGVLIATLTHYIANKK